VSRGEDYTDAVGTDGDRKDRGFSLDRRRCS